MKNHRKKPVSIIFALFLSLVLLLPISGPAQASSVNSIDRVRALSPDFKGVASTLTIREDDSLINSFRDGDRFRLQLKPGIKWLRDSAGTYVDENGLSVATTISNANSGTANLIITIVSDTTMEINLPNGDPAFPITDNNVRDNMTIPLSVDFNGTTGEMYVIIDPLDSAVSAFDSNFTNVATVGHLPQIVDTSVRGWNEIATSLGSLTSGSKRTIKLNGNNDIPSDVFNAVLDKDVTLRFEVGIHLAQEINGTDISQRLTNDTKLHIPLNTNGISRDMFSAFTGITETRQFNIGNSIPNNIQFTMHMSLDRKNSRQHATLFRKTDNSLSRIATSTIDSNGWAAWPFEQIAADYLIIISKEVIAEEPPVPEAPEAPVEKPQEPEPTPPVWANPFKDINESDWFYDAVQFVHERGLLNGIGDNLFGHTETMSRGMMVTALWRLAGNPTGCESNFTDVAAEEWYATAVSWASANGIVQGHTETTFAPNASVTREQMAAILYRYAGHSAAVTTAGEAPVLAEFPDWPSVSDWGRTPLSWCYENGIIQGKATGTTTVLDPGGMATRAEVAAILKRFVDKGITGGPAGVAGFDRGT
jgi:hypothetical protein